MKILVIGGAGFIGQRLIEQVLATGKITGANGESGEVREVVCFDQAESAYKHPKLKSIVGTLTDGTAIDAAMGDDTTNVFHLAAVVSSAAEADLELGLRINLHGTLTVLDAASRQSRPPRFVFASSVAAFGGDLPAVVDDNTPLTPASSYGAQKAMGELLVNDYSRRGLIDGRALRLPTVVIRPGRPNAAASSFASGIIREPLAGQASNCPVPTGTAIAVISPRKVVDGLLQANNVSADAFGSYRAMNLPGLSVTVAEMLKTLEKFGGREAVERVSFEPDAKITRIVSTWPREFTSQRAVAAGFAADAGFDEIVKAYIEDQAMASSAGQAS